MNDPEQIRLPQVVESRKLAESWHAKIFEDTLRYGSNRTAPYWRFEVPNFTLAIGVREDGKIPLVKQYRHGAKRSFWEFPAGLLEQNETPLDCVRREFIEEIGHELINPVLLSKFFPYAGRTDQVAYVYSGRVGRAVGQKLDTVEELEVAFVEEGSISKLLSENISATHLLAYLLYQDSRDHPTDKSATAA
ncbi:MAG: NUDIX hydrolase [Candidatus Bathyarchaeia archaeon]